MQNEDAGPTICLHMASASYTWPGKLVYWFKAVGSKPALSVLIQFPLLPLFQKPNRFKIVKYISSYSKTVILESFTNIYMYTNDLLTCLRN